MRNKQRTAKCYTLNGSEVNNVALSRTGVPQLGDRMNFMTMSRDGGSVKDKSKQNTEGSVS